MSKIDNLTMLVIARMPLFKFKIRLICFFFLLRKYLKQLVFTGEPIGITGSTITTDECSDRQKSNVKIIVVKGGHSSLQGCDLFEN